MDDQSLEESIQVLLEGVPTPVRAFVINDLSDAVQRYMDKYRLHVDQGGALQQELLLMLVGHVDPAEFMGALRKEAIPEPVIQSLIVDINEEIFKPLRKKEQESGLNEPLPSRPPLPPPAPGPTPAPLRTMQADMEVAREAPPPAWQPPAPPIYAPHQQPVSQQTYWIPVSVSVMPQAPMPYPMPPVPEAYPAMPPPLPTPPPPVQREAPPPPPIYREAPPNLPTEATVSEPPPLRKEYGTDPYRESV